MNRRLILLVVQRSLLIIPMLYLAAAVLLGSLTRQLDGLAWLPLHSDVELATAQTILNATATGMLAFTGLVVSSTLLVVQFAASQYSPRLILWFRRDPLVKHAIGSFLAASVYPIVALRVLGTSPAAEPDVAVSLSLALLIGAALLFLGLLQRVLDRLRPRNLLGAVLRDGIAAGAATYPRRLDAVSDNSRASDGDERWHASDAHELRLHHHRGVLASFDGRSLLSIATATKTTIELVPAVGSYLMPGAVLFRVHGANTMAPKRLLATLVVTDERTIKQDPAFALRMMVDTATRALSPAVNDPTTAVQAIDVITDLLRELAQRDMEHSLLRDESGAVRVVWPAPSWDHLLDLGFAEIRHYGASSVQVCRRLRAALTTLIDVTDPQRHPALQRHLAALDLAAQLEAPEASLAAGSDPIGIGSTD